MIFPIREESVQRLSVSHRLYLVRETLPMVYRGKRHNPSQPVIEPCVAERLAVELREDVSNLDSVWCAKDSLSDHRSALDAMGDV